MPFFVSKRHLSELHGAISRLRDRAERAEAAELVQASANGRLARTVQLTEATAENIASAYRMGRRELLAENARLREVVAQQATTIRGLSSQLDNALGYTPEEIALLEAGPTRKAITA